jgi:hypothetical protein
MVTNRLAQRRRDWQCRDVGIHRRNASGWCKVLKVVQGFNVIVTLGWVFHKVFNRLVENQMPGAMSDTNPNETRPRSRHNVTLRYSC